MKNEIKNSLKIAMLAKDTVKISTLRSIITKITEAEKVNGSELNEESIIKVIDKLSKQREESISLYQKGGRIDLVEAEEKELKILKEYLPEKFSYEKTKEIVSELISSGVNNMGSIMKELNQYGNLVDKKIASTIIKELV